VSTRAERIVNLEQVALGCSGTRTDKTPPYFACQFPLYIVGTFLVSEVFYQLIEHPSTILGRTLEDRIKGKRAYSSM